MRKAAILAFLLTAPLPSHAEGEPAGDFDYYVMSLSWSPNWCALTGDDRRDPQCKDGLGLTFILHGLWPQYDDGYPSYCRTTQHDPSRTDSASMADIMGGSGLAWYQWKKHGRCADLPARNYYSLMRRAYSSVTIPPVFAKITKDQTVPASVIEDAFLDSNPTLARDQVTVTCKSGMIQEVRICLTKDLGPRRCGPDVIRDCTLTDAGLDAVR
jgi:ribonuclease T2